MPGPHISATHCWARPRTVHGQVGRIPMTRIERATWGVMRDIGVMRGAVSACMRHIVVKRRLAPSP